MKQIIIKVSNGNGSKVVSIAEEFNGANINFIKAEHSDIVITHHQNSKVEPFLKKISNIEKAEITLNPNEILTLVPPPEKASGKIINVQPKSSLEVYLRGLQSVGSYKGFIGYAASGGILAWLGLYNNSVYMLIAAMLISPFAGPAMNAAIASATGDVSLLKKGLQRYFIALFIAFTASFILSAIFNVETATPMMVQISQVSQAAFILPLISGIAGAFNLIHSERDSLVSGTAVGILVSAALAPPIAIIGMSAFIGKWEFIKSGIYLLILQLAGINLSAALVFRFYGKLKAKGIRFINGNEKIFKYSIIISAVIIAGFMFFQYSSSPNLQKGTLDTKLIEIINTSMKDIEEVKMFESKVRFTEGNLENTEQAVCEIYVIRSGSGANRNNEAVREKIVSQMKEEIAKNYSNIFPVFNIIFLEE